VASLPLAETRHRNTPPPKVDLAENTGLAEVDIRTLIW